MYADVGPPLVVMTIGLVLWLAVTATVGGIEIQTVGVILFLAGLVWLMVELIQARSARGVVVDEPAVYREPAPVVQEPAPVVRERTYRDPRL